MIQSAENIYISTANMKDITGGKRYALLMAARDSDYAKKVYGGYFNVFVSAFGEEGERWDLFRVVDGEFPDLTQLHLYDGFVVSGSPFDAYGDDDWILRLCFLLQSLDAMEKKVLGICFGHQVLCRALGGKVGKACSGWDIGLRRINFVKEPSAACGFVDELDRLSTTASLSIIECHQDEVLEIPPGAQVIACSDKTGVEMFTVGHHILGIQGHPEYTKDILCNLVDRLLGSNCIAVLPYTYDLLHKYLSYILVRLSETCSNLMVLQKEFADKAKAGLEVADPDRMYLEKICKNFLKNRDGDVASLPF